MRHASTVLALAALLSATVAASGDPQGKPKPPAPRKTVPKPVPAAPAPVVAPEPEPPPPPPATDVRMKTAYTQGAQVSQNTTYLQGPRQRVEFPGVVTLDQCDLKRSVMLNTSAKRYRVQPYLEAATVQASTPPAVDAQTAQMAQMAQMMGTTQAPQPPQAAQPRGGVVAFTTTLTDTLERQTMLGFDARRIKTIVIKQSSGNACDKSPLKVEVDAWYVDLPPQSGCARAAAVPVAPPPSPDASACTDRIETRVVGDVKLGFPIKTVTTSTTGEGDKLDVSISSQEVTELEITRLDRALFGSTADGTSMAAPKKPGTIRIGILEPINKTARNLPPSSLRQDLAAKFNKAPYEAIPVAGSSPSAIEQEAARLQCDYLMLTEIVEAKTSKPGKMGGVMRMTGGGPPKDSHDVKLEYKLYAVGATHAPKVSGNAKASNGGFGVGSALRLAAFAGQVYLSLMGGMGGMMNPMAAMSGMGGLGPMGGGFFDPRATAMTSMFSGLSGGMMSGTGAMPGMPGVADPYHQIG